MEVLTKASQLAWNPLQEVSNINGISYCYTLELLLVNYEIVVSSYCLSLLGSAASRVDLKAGDQLVTMDNNSLAGLDHSEIIKTIQKVIA